MKRMMMTLVALVTWMASAMSMNYSQARNEALFLTDKMAYELNLSNMQYEAVYEINLDYLLSVGNQTDLFGTYWKRRNTDLKYVLSSSQFKAYKRIDYFYRPLAYNGTVWSMSIYTRYTNRTSFYYDRPSNWSTYYGGYNRLATSHYRGRTYNPPTATNNHGNRPPTFTGQQPGGWSRESFYGNGQSNQQRPNGTPNTNTGRKENNRGKNRTGNGTRNFSGKR